MDLSGDVLECPQCQDLIDCRREYGHGELSTGRSGSTDLPAELGSASVTVANREASNHSRRNEAGGCSVPLHRFTQTFLKTHDGPQSQCIARRRDVGKRMPYIRLAWFGIYRTLAIPRRPLKDGVNLVQRSLTAGCQVENTAVYLIGGRLNGQQICLNALRSTVNRDPGWARIR
jgi:hypothetical protein